MPDIVVVGAGVAGLTAARSLSLRGKDVEVVEARARLGGRIDTRMLGGAPVDLGGSWVHGPIGNPLISLLEELALPTRSDGVWGLGMDVFVEGAGWADATTVASVVASRHDWDPAEATDRIGGEAPSHSQGTSWYVRDRDIAPPADRIVHFSLDWLEGALNVGGLPEAISLEGSAAYLEHGGGNWLVEGGYGQLVGRLADGLTVSTDERVEHLAHGAGVEIETTRRTLHANRAIVSVPLGVLQSGHITFDPPLPSQPAIDRLAMATLEKIVFTFDKPVWPDHRRRVVFVSDDHRFPAWANLSSRPDITTIVAFYNPRATPSIEATDARDRIPLAREVFDMITPEAPEPQTVHATDWMSDPLSAGSYSFIPVGATAADMHALAHPVSDHLTLAGEHTVAAYFGTVHGAYVSGLRAADWAAR